MKSIIIDNLPLPPSVNKLYFTKGGRRHLSAAGAVYHHKVKISILGALAFFPEFMEGLDTPLVIEMTFYFKSLENKGWLQGKTKDRYKRVDLSNRIKVLEDAVADALSIDDKLYFSLILHKIQRAQEGVLIRITKAAHEDYIQE